MPVVLCCITIPDFFGTNTNCDSTCISVSSVSRPFDSPPDSCLIMTGVLETADAAGTFYEAETRYWPFFLPGNDPGRSAEAEDETSIFAKSIVVLQKLVSCRVRLTSRNREGGE